MLIIDGKAYYKQDVRITRASLYRAFGVRRKSYMSRLIDRIFEYYFSNAINLRTEYKKYYQLEFNNFDDYLSHKHNLFNEEIRRLSSKGRCYYKNISIDKDYDVEFLMEDKALFGIIAKLTGGIQDEN
ncbi:MAG: hypothetical protein LBR44_07305 [Clostridiales Family XIII bacterium]|jgi:hypothetical protein|nr:hypothetical protein [Clostridiales Family XIII bacterium]